MKAFQQSLNKILIAGSAGDTISINENLNNDQYNHKNFYSEILLATKKIGEIPTFEPISIFKEFNAGDDFISIVKKLKNNFYILHKTECNVKILFVTKTIYDQKAKVEFHFKENKLIYTSFSFSDLANEHRQSFVDRLLYRNVKLKLNNDSKIIKDNLGNIVLIEDSMTLNVSFFNPQHLNSFLNN
jgi:hypothetical protein